MIIGVPKEIKDQETRVAVTPAGVTEFTKYGHTVYVETGAGLESGFNDQDYEQAGAIISSRDQAWQKGDLIMKVKEPIEEEFKFLRQDMVIFTYLHLAANKKLARALTEKKVIGIAYETVQSEDGRLPLLTPMSEVAGRMALQTGSVLLEKHISGKGLLLDGVPGVPPAHVVIIGTGVVGSGAIKRAVGVGARVTVIGTNVDRLKYLNEVHNDRLETLVSNEFNIANALKTADLVISTALIPGSKAPKIITDKMLRDMPKDSVIVDISIDQGGTVEGIDTPTFHAHPVIRKHGIFYYGVPNIPGAVPKTSTLALTNATLDYAIKLANLGWHDAVLEDKSLLKGINTLKGHIVYEPVARALNMEYTNIEELL